MQRTKKPASRHSSRVDYSRTRHRERLGLAVLGLTLSLACSGCARFSKHHSAAPDYAKDPESPLQAPGLLQASSGDPPSLDGPGPRSFDPFRSRSSPLFRLEGSPAPELWGAGYFQNWPNLQQPSQKDIEQLLRDRMPAPANATITRPIPR